MASPRPRPEARSGTSDAAQARGDGGRAGIVAPCALGAGRGATILLCYRPREMDALPSPPLSAEQANLVARMHELARTCFAPRADRKSVV